jgi:hypothetical protein
MVAAIGWAYPGNRMPPKRRLEAAPVIEAYKKDVDRTRVRESLKLTATQRFERLMEMQRFAEEMARAGRPKISRPSLS